MGPGSSVRVYYCSLLVASLLLRQAFSSSSSSSSELSTHHLGIRDVAHNEANAKASKKCPNGWLSYQSRCYGLFTDPLTWTAAEIECIYSGNGHLASIHSFQEMERVVKYIKNINQDVDSVWIGLYDPRENRQWEWSDLSIARFKSWDFGEPNNADKKELCVHLVPHTGHRKWNDEKCSLEMAYLCKY